MALRQFVDIRFQVLFHSPPGVLFAFPSRYSFAIGRQRVFSLGEWSPRIHAGLHVPGTTQVSVGSRSGFAYGALTLYRPPFQRGSAASRFLTSRLLAGRTLQPRQVKARRFGLLPVRSPLLGESR